MTIKSKLYFSSLLIFTALIIGCGGIAKSYPERAYFLFEVAPPTSPLTPVQGATVKVRRFSISPGSEGKQFIYRTTDIQYLSDFYNQFFRPPSIILTEAVTQWLDQAQVFEDVLNPLSQAFPGYFIEGNIVELYGDYRNQSAAQAVMKIQFYLLQTSDDGDQPAIIFGKTYESTKPIGTATPQNLMNGWNLALENILGEFLTDVSYHLKSAQQSSNNQSTNNN